MNQFTLTGGTQVTVIQPLENTENITIQELVTPTDRLNAIGNLPDAVGWLHNDGTGTFVYSTPTAADVGLGNVENTALSTWSGTANITTLGTVASGIWHGTAIDDAYISSAATWNAKVTMTYPGAGIGVSTGSAWTTSLSSTAPYFTTSVKTPIWLPNADGTTALQITKADGSTPVVIVDTTNSRVKVGGTAVPSAPLEVAGLAQNVQMIISSYSATSSQQPSIQLRKSHSNTETLVATVDTETLGYLGFFGVNAAGPTAVLAASIEVVQNGTQGGSDTFPAADMIFKTSPGGTTARVERFRIKKSGVPNFSALPTSSAGLASGDIWCDQTGGLNILKRV